MILGQVVLVVGQLDERIRPSGEEVVFGTIIYIDGANVEVLLSNGNIFRGLRREVASTTTEESC